MQSTNSKILSNLGLEDVQRVRCQRSFYYFLQTFWHVVVPEQPVWNWHMEYLCGELQKMVFLVRDRQPKDYDMIINVPPGTSKSTICTIMLPVWAWVIDPTIRIMTASYSSSLSTDHGTKSRDVLRDKKFKRMFPEIEIRRDVDGKTWYKNKHGGDRFSTSVGGSALGFHAHLIIVDDPVSPKGSASEADRLTANNFMDMTLSTRKVDKAITPTILVMQRLHQNDPSGNWLEKRSNIKHICLPAELSKDVQPEELKANYVDGLFDPIRLNRSMLKELRDNLGSYGYAGQMMQIPSPADGGIWQRWIIPIDDDEVEKMNLRQVGTDWDLAYTKSEQNSASGYVTAGKHNNDMIILDVGFDWLEFPKLITLMKTKRAPHYIEDKASGKSAKQVLMNSGIPAVEVKIQGGDKIARATMATPYAEAGLVYCRRKLLDKLYNDSRQGILVFPNGEGDDMQDALVQAINRLLGRNQNKVRKSNVY